MGLFRFFRKRKQEKALNEVESRYESNGLLEGEKLDGSTAKRYLLEQCEALTQCTTDLISARQEYESVTSYLTDIQIIENMDEEEHKRLVDIASSILSLEESKETMQNKVDKLPDAKFNIMDREKDDIPKAIGRLKENEQTQYIMKRDLDYLEGEKVEWIYEKSELEQEQKLLRKLSRVGVVLESILVCAFLSLFLLNYDAASTVVLVGLLVLGVVLCGILIRMENIKSQIKRCVINYNRAVKIQNSIKFKYVNITNAVDYAHERFQVTSAKELEKQWQLYLEAVKERERLSQANDDLSYYRESLMRLLRQYNLYDARVWPYQAAALVNAKEMVEVKHVLLERRQKIRNRIEKAVVTMKELRDEIVRLSKEQGVFTSEMKGILESVNKLLG